MNIIFEFKAITVSFYVELNSGNVPIILVFVFSVFYVYIWKPGYMLLFFVFVHDMEPEAAQRATNRSERGHGAGQADQVQRAA